MDKHLNQTVHQGRIIGKRSSKNITSFILETTKSNDGKYKNNIRIICFGQIAENMKRFKTGDFVKVIGHGETIDVKDSDGKYVKTSQDIVADIVEKASSPLDELEAKASVPIYDKKNEFKIAGTLVRIQKHGKKWIFTILTADGGKANHILVSMREYPHNEGYLNSLEIKDNLYLSGTIQSQAKETKSGKHYIEEWVGYEIATLE